MRGRTLAERPRQASRLAVGPQAMRREADGDSGAAVLLAVDVERAAMQLDETLAERQAEPGALIAAAELARNLGERHQRLPQLILGDTDAGIRDGNVEPAIGTDEGAQGDRPVARRELDGIGEQVDQDLLEILPVAVEQRQSG